MMFLLYGAVLFVLECWFACDSCFGVEAVTWFKVCGEHECCNIAPLELCGDLDVLCWACVLFSICCMIQSCLRRSVEFSVIVSG